MSPWGGAVSEVLQALIASPWLLVVVFLVAGLDAILPLAPSETTVIAAGVGVAAAGPPRLVVLIAVAAAGAYVGDRLSRKPPTVCTPSTRGGVRPTSVRG